MGKRGICYMVNALIILFLLPLLFLSGALWVFFGVACLMAANEWLEGRRPE